MEQDDPTRIAKPARGLFLYGKNGKHKRVQASTTDGAPHTGATKKLTPEQVAEARKMYAAFKTQREIAAKFGVVQATISKYLRRGHAK